MWLITLSFLSGSLCSPLFVTCVLLVLSVQLFPVLFWRFCSSLCLVAIYISSVIDGFYLCLPVFPILVSPIISIFLVYLSPYAPLCQIVCFVCVPLLCFPGFLCVFGIGTLKCILNTVCALKDLACWLHWFPSFNICLSFDVWVAFSLNWHVRTINLVCIWALNSAPSVFCQQSWQPETLTLLFQG